MQDTTIYLATAGTRKVHMEMSFLPGQPTCDRTETITGRIAALSDDSGQNGTIAALTDANIAPSRLCRHCFGARLLATYAKQRAARLAI